MSTESVEQKRQEYRPAQVLYLFIGESAPANGTFFYSGDSNLARYTREAFERVLGDFADTAQFLGAFQQSGCYLLDLCDTPVDALDRQQRRAARKQAIRSLSDPLSGMRPSLIVVVMKAIEREAAAAVRQAGLGDVTMRVLPFPAHGHQREYVEQLTELVRQFA